MRVTCPEDIGESNQTERVDLTILECLLEFTNTVDKNVLEGEISIKSNILFLISPPHPKEHINNVTERLFYFFL